MHPGQDPLDIRPPRRQDPQPDPPGMGPRSQIGSKIPQSRYPDMGPMDYMSPSFQRPGAGYSAMGYRDQKASIAAQAWSPGMRPMGPMGYQPPQAGYSGMESIGPSFQQPGRGFPGMGPPRPMRPSYEEQGPMYPDVLSSRLPDPKPRNLDNRLGTMSHDGCKDGIWTCSNVRFLSSPKSGSIS